MTLTGRELIDFVNSHGEDEVGVCECSHWSDEHHDGTCNACLDDAADQDDPHAVADHEFIFSDEGTAESEYLNQEALELGFPFGDQELEEKDRTPQRPLVGEDAKADQSADTADSWFIAAALQEYQEEGSIEVDVDKPEVSRNEEGAYVKAWLFVEHPPCEAAIGIHLCARRWNHDGPHACDEKCTLGHLRLDQLQSAA